MLLDLIRRRIREQGPVSFSWYMAQALYHPALGYYTSPAKRIGRKGDFYTNVSVGPVFGRILASQLVEMWDLLDRPSPFTIVEEGAEDGQLAMDILSALEVEFPKTQAAFRYVIVEPFRVKQAIQRTNLESRFPNRVVWVSSADRLEPITGAFLSNELVDAMPVDLVEFREDRWWELLVGVSGDTLQFERAQILRQDLLGAVQMIPTPTIQPYRTEAHLAAADWIRNLGSLLHRGFVLLVDYGFSRSEYYRSDRVEGTLSCYSLHRRLPNPLERPGEVDITAHVDFTSLAESAVLGGMTLAGFTDQHHFMVGSAEKILLEFEKYAEKAGEAAKRASFLRSYLTLMHPVQMGLAFKYMLCTKGVSAEAKLTGFRYATHQWQGWL